MAALALAAAFAGFASAAPATDYALVKRAPNTFPAIISGAHDRVKNVRSKLGPYLYPVYDRAC